MAIFRPFRAIRPQPQFAASVAALPYDTMNSEEARAQVEGNPLSFLHVDKAEIDLPRGTNLYADEVYTTAADNLVRLRQEGIFLQDDAPRFFIYRQTWKGRSQTGLVGCAAIDDYKNDVIKKHELTHPDKEADRIRHVTACNANTGPIFLTYRDTQETSLRLSAWQESHERLYDFISGDSVHQEVWMIDDQEMIAQLREAFAQTPNLYIADGHHRCASAARVGLRKRQEFPQFTGGEEFNYFLAVAFPQDQLAILDYNRVVRDLGCLEADEFLSRTADQFSVEKIGDEGEPYHPESSHYFGMLLDGQWYRLRARKGSYDDADPVARLDVEILQKNLLAPLLGITDPRRDKRIEFIGGIRGLGELERRCREDMRLAFSMYPTTLQELMDIADSGNIMPPKSTWFEPKLLSGLFIHELTTEA
jgi:uncharacterized protein (DUF1015 family)